MKFLPPQRATAEFSDSRRGFRPRKKGKATAIARVVCEALDVRLQDLIQFQKPSMRDSKRFLTRCKGSVFTIRRRFSIRSGFVNQRHAGSNGWLMARKPRKPAPRETVEPRAGRRCEYCRAPQPATGTRVFPDWLGRYFRAPRAQPDPQDHFASPVAIWRRKLWTMNSTSSSSFISCKLLSSVTWPCCITLMRSQISKR